MDLKKIFKKKGFKHLIIKSLVFVFFLVLMQVICAPLAKVGAVPGEFKPFSFLQVGEALLFTFMLFVIYNRKKLLNVDTYKLRIRDMAFLPLAFLMLAGNYYVCMNVHLFEGHVYAFIALISLMLFLMSIFLALGVFGWKMTHNLYSEYRAQLKWLILFFLAYYFLFSFVQGMWPFFSAIVAKLVSVCLGVIYPDISYSINEEGIPSIIIGTFGAKIGAPCSGIESMLLFTSLFLIIVAVDFKKIDLKRALIVFFPALAGVFLLNVIRISALFMVGIHISREFAVGMFHANAGYILFCAYFFIFLWYVYPWIAHKKELSDRRIAPPVLTEAPRRLNLHTGLCR